MSDTPHARHDVNLLFATRIVRIFCYGLLQVVWRYISIKLD